MSDLEPGVREGLARFLHALVSQARACGRERVAVVRARERAPLDAVAAFEDMADEERFLLEQPSSGSCLVAGGAVAAIETSGVRRFALADAERGALAARIAVHDLDPPAALAPPPPSPRLIGGFAFDAAPPSDAVWSTFPALRFVLPRLVFVQSAGPAHAAATWRCVAIPLSARDDADERLAVLERSLAAPAHGNKTARRTSASSAAAFRIEDERGAGDYERRVSHALAAIHAGDVEKLVVARALHLQTDVAIRPGRVLAQLREAHPSCAVFAVGRGERCFVGATPERLVRRDGLRVRVDALAGSAPRGRTPEEDEALRGRLRESKKEQAEHASVVHAMARDLASVCARIDRPEAPGVRAFEAIQHLHTPIEARLGSAATSLLALAARLHPTPAVGGAPRAAACAWLRRHEALARGWYTGGVGWLTPDGDGEIHVALRCALLRETEAWLWAGAGIVDGSTPSDERAETRLKLQPLLGALLEI